MWLRTESLDNDVVKQLATVCAETLATLCRKRAGRCPVNKLGFCPIIDNPDCFETTVQDWYDYLTKDSL